MPHFSKGCCIGDLYFLCKIILQLQLANSCSFFIQTILRKSVSVKIANDQNNYCICWKIFSDKSDHVWFWKKQGLESVADMQFQKCKNLEVTSPIVFFFHLVFGFLRAQCFADVCGTNFVCKPTHLFYFFFRVDIHCCCHVTFMSHVHLGGPFENIPQTVATLKGFTA